MFTILLILIFALSILKGIEQFQVYAYNSTSIIPDEKNLYDDETNELLDILSPLNLESIPLTNMQLIPDIMLQSFPLINVFKDRVLQILTETFNKLDKYKGKLKVIKEPGIYDMSWKNVTSTSRLYSFKIDIHHERKNFVRTFHVGLLIPFLTDPDEYLSGSSLYTLQQNIKLVSITIPQKSSENVSYNPILDNIPYQNMYTINNKLGLFDPYKDKHIILTPIQQ